MDKKEKKHLTGLLLIMLITLAVPLASLLVISICPVLAGQFEASVEPTSIAEDTSMLLIFMINNTDTTANITQVNITLPSNFVFVQDTNKTTVSNATFYNTSNQCAILTWEKIPLILGGKAEYFWFNVTALIPCSYNFTIATIDTSNSTNQVDVGIMVSASLGINITNPQNKTYFSQQNSSLFPLNYNVNHLEVDSCWYSIDSNQNITLPKCTNTTFNVSGYGGHTLTLWANDSNGNEDLATVVFTLKNCTVPADDLYINSDTILCSGFYNLQDSGSNGVIILNASNIILDCNGSTLNGTGLLGYGIYYNKKINNFAIINCIIQNYNSSIGNDYAVSSSNSIIFNNTIINNKRGIHLFSFAQGNISYNTITNNLEDGIALSAIATDTVIAHNNILNNKRDGIHYNPIEGFIFIKNVISHNNIMNNSNNGIYIAHANNFNIINNNIAGSNKSIYIAASPYKPTIGDYLFKNSSISQNNFQLFNYSLYNEQPINLTAGFANITAQYNYFGSADCKDILQDNTIYDYRDNQSKAAILFNPILDGAWPAGSPKYCYINESKCSDECSAGERKCIENTYVICGNYGADECLEWSAIIKCALNEVCKEGYCIRTCSDECIIGNIECTGVSSYHVCGNYDADSCLEWSAIIECGNGKICRDGECVGETCIPNWICDEWSDCISSYKLDHFEGKQERDCNDINGCLPSKIETMSCQLEFEIEAKTYSGDGGTSVTDIYNLKTNETIAKIEKGEKAGMPYLDIALIIPIEIGKKVKKSIVPAPTIADNFLSYSKWFILSFLIASLAIFLVAYSRQVAREGAQESAKGRRRGACKKK